MLISFTIENWLSFRDAATFSMVASREKQHRERTAYLPDYDLRLLPIAAVYGGNASGKTNLFKALHFAKTMVVHGTQPDQPINVQPFRLDEYSRMTPSSFIFQLMVEGRCYEFGFRVTQQLVVEEWLYEKLKTTDKLLYHRKLTDDVWAMPNIEFASHLREDQFYQFAFQGTRWNQLFLTNAVNQNVELFKPIYNWFRDRLVMIAPDDRFTESDRMLREGHPLSIQINEALARLDTGIVRLAREEVPIDALPSWMRKLAQGSQFSEQSTVIFQGNMGEGNERYVMTFNKGETKVWKLVSYHQDAQGGEIRFDLNEESDGTQRLIDLLPTFLGLHAREKAPVLIIDELDRSLHTLLTRQLLENYLNAYTEQSRAQVLFTTHDLQLMDQDLLRRDEMWVTERDVSGNSSLIAFSDYKEIRKDKDIRRSYLQGRLGGVPRVLLSGAFGVGDNTDETEAAS